MMVGWEDDSMFEDEWMWHVMRCMSSDFIELNSIPKGIPLHIPEVWGGLGLYGEWDDREVVLYRALVARNRSCGSYHEERDVSPYYKNTLKELGNRYGYTHGISYRVGKMQWHAIGDAYGHENDNLAEVLAEWDKLERMIKLPQFLNSPTARDDVPRDLFPIGRIPNVLLNDSTPSLTSIQAWRRSNAKWEPKWGSTNFFEDADHLDEGVLWAR